MKAYVPFAIGFSDSLNNHLELRKLIIDNLPDDNKTIKDKLLVLFYFEQKKDDEAFKILRSIDLSSLRYFECQQLMQIVQKKKAWDVERTLIEKLLHYEKEPKVVINLKLKLFNAHNNLKDYSSVVKIGNEILEEHANQNFIESTNKEALLAHTIQANLNRGEDDEAYDTLKKYKFLSISPEFKVSIETNVFLKKNLPIDALNSLVTAVKIKKRLFPEEYASLFFLFIEIGNQTKLDFESLESVELNCFVKLKNQDRWYYIGEQGELDATLIEKQQDKFSIFIDKKVGDAINFSNKYSSEETVEIVEFIFPIKKYINWQIRYNFERLSKEERWDRARMIEVPPMEDSVDTKYLEAFLQDEQEKRNPLFELYCDKNIPLALLALNEGGLGLAIARIVNERKGFIKCSTGVILEMENQKRIAENVINKNLPFFIDGTSALFLAEIGLLEKIYANISNIKIPQSVISMLFEFANRFRLVPGEGGTLGFARGQIIVSTYDKEKSNRIHDNFMMSIKILESENDNVIAISSVNKLDCPSESKVHPELSDACILAQMWDIPILTEDYLYLQMNELETRKKAPEYFSSVILMRALYERGKISFDEYLKYFGYLSSYRVRFLSLNADDINKAVFGEGRIFNVQPENIRNFNFPLTLSEEYGVPLNSSFNVLLTFLYEIIIDDSITVEIAEAIYAEILYLLPKEKNKREYGRMLLSVCDKKIKNHFTLILSATIKEKLSRLLNLTNIFSYDIIL